MVKVLFIEPPKDYWFVMGEYLPPPYGLLQLAGYLETKMPEAEIEILDCQAMSLDWKGLEKRIDSFNPDIVATIGFATCNTYVSARTLETAKKDSHESIEELRQFIGKLDPDLAIFMILTPFPGTDLFEQAKQNGWIENWNWADYDMAHAIMPTESLNREQPQYELYKCYRSFFGSWTRRIEGFFSKNRIKRRVYRYMVQESVLRQLKSLI